MPSLSTAEISELLKLLQETEEVSLATSLPVLLRALGPSSPFQALSVVARALQVCTRQRCFC